MSEESEREARAAVRRATWTMRKLDRDDGSIPTPEGMSERVAFAYELSMRIWALSGRPMPEYTRANIPTRIVRPPR